MKVRAWFLTWSFLAFLMLSGCTPTVAPAMADSVTITLNHSGVAECHVSGLTRRASDFMAVDSAAVLSL